MEPNVLRAGLIQSRHELPVDTYVLDAIEDVHAYSSIERRIKEWLHENVIETELDHVIIYITGLGSAVTSFLKMWTWACSSHTMPLLDIAHHDRDTDDYNRQPWDVMFE
jgi:hypothetical protein|tara:strand:+ start:101 stop:427 length:327 start_codon:yes stop_codon:yes gene_type:complete